MIKKDIQKIFKDNTYLLEELEVKELIEYCRDLEGEIFEKEIEKNNKENYYLEMIRDIFNSCKDIDNSNKLHERYPRDYSKIESEDIIKNLKTFILNLSKDYGFRL